MYVLPLAVSMTAALLTGILRKLLVDRYENSERARHLQNAVASLVAAVCLLLVGGVPQASLFTVLLALGFGFVTALQQVFTLQALELGPYAYTAVICSLSTMIPALSGALFFKETLGFSHILGMLLMVVCFFLSADFSGEKKKTTLRWLLCCAVAFLATGLIGVMQKWHQSTDYRTELDAFLVIAFAFSCFYSAAAFTVSLLKNKRKAAPGNAAPSLFHLLPILLMAMIGICTATNNKLNLFLSGVMESAVFFPLVNGGNLILTALAALLLFRERPTGKQWAGLLIGTLAVVFLCNPFAGT